MGIFKLQRKTFSKKRTVEDELFDDEMYELRRETKHAPVMGAIGGGLAGGIVGAGIGKHHGRNAVIGAVGLGGLGYGLGKMSKNQREREVAKYENQYDRASKEERAILRKKIEAKRQREAMHNAAREGGREAALWGSILR